MGGSYSDKVPRSSAKVHRVFVHHILEDEVDGQKEGQGDQREDGEEEVNGVVFFVADMMHMVFVMENDTWESQEWMEPKVASPFCSLPKTSKLIRSLRDDEQL